MSMKHGISLVAHRYVTATQTTLPVAIACTYEIELLRLLGSGHILT